MDVDVYTAELVPQLMPGVCVKTGQPAVTTRKLKVQHIPPWVYFLLPLVLLGVGILLVAIIAEAAATKFTIVFPVSAQVMADRRRRIRLAWGFGAVGTIALCALGIKTGQPLCWLLAALSLCVGLYFAQSTRNWLRGKLSADGRVTLRNAAPVWVAQQHALVQAHRAAIYQAAAYQQQWAQQHYAAQEYGAHQQQYGAQQYPA
ncbi:MAG TPA: hypothetical protein VN683_12845 [Acidothermaceae bacterium]|nr:hypothetical protein [Acidothermaceae bacterium]